MTNNISVSEYKIFNEIVFIQAGGIVRYLLKCGLPFSRLKLISFDMANM